MIVLLPALMAPAGLRAEEVAHCGPARALPAYAHNDYRNEHPCEEALALGYRGVEADLFFIGGTFFLAHDRGEVRDGFDFESVYLQPLLARVQRCSRILPDPRPFVITIEDKAPTAESRAALAALLARYRDLLQSTPEGPIAVFILVDDAATPESVPEGLRELAGLQWRATAWTPAPPASHAADYVLLSLDYGKVVGDPDPALDEMVPEMVAAAKRAPGCLVRVHHVPVRRRLWARLLEAGVDLIGVTDLPKGAATCADANRAAR